MQVVVVVDMVHSTTALSQQVQVVQAEVAREELV
jgi:hypothetical protein